VLQPTEYARRYAQSLSDPDAFWAEQAKALTWFHAPSSTYEADTEGADVAWFSGGRLNASVNCVDRHAVRRPGKTALIWAKNEPGQYERISYRTLKHRVGQLANVLKARGVRRGDHVVVYLPSVPEAVYSMLACARIGAVHVLVFTGFSAEALRERILDCKAKVLITANEGLRGEQRVPLKARVDDAVSGVAHIECVLMARRTDQAVPMTPGRDLYLEDEMAQQRSTCPAEWMAAEDPLFVAYTSGGSPAPKGIVHTTAGYLLYVARTQAELFADSEDTIHFCPSNVGCITGHSYIVYGPLANGQTSVLFEATPKYPAPDRYWRVIEETGAHTLLASASALRALMQYGPAWVRGHDLSSLRLLATLGEPTSPQLWSWFHEVVGRESLPLMDTWWQTETGGIVLAGRAGGTDSNPADALRPFFGVRPALVGDDGTIDDSGPSQGRICISGSWPGQARTIHGNHRRFRETFFSKYAGLFATEDRAERDEDGTYRITERGDDVLNVGGYRFGAAEIEQALCSHEAVQDSTVVPVPDDIKGQGIYAFVVLRGENSAWRPDELAGALKEQVRHTIGPMATPDTIQVVDALPRTRAGQVQRQRLRREAADGINNHHV